MPTEQRVIASTPRPAGGIRAGRSGISVAPAPAEEKAKPTRSRKKLLLLLGVVVVLVAGAAAYVFLLAPDDGAAPPPEPPPVAGEVLTVPSISVNLADGRYLRLGLGLQLTADVEEAPEPARALDLAIALFSGRSIQEISDPTIRAQLKTELAQLLAEAYEGEVMDVYLTDYVTQ
ncbi:flagellar basal body-associated FliL family protein [Cellulomonas fimi]|uniref:Flagellar protein FliL n=1 Tax=Cellulomonas fimi TaxID=1708 RepID=A0A7Y0QJ77_CELFI|nr:flagellar basal body-associated FliL family protein [Cellulomonas fimi]NMR21062.1 flagellar basal body-associated FliL family protein [Cellulomonas fimi]